MITRKLLFCLICCVTAVFALDEPITVEKENLVEIQNAFTHVDLGLGPFPLPLPSFALGHRNQWGHHGLDVSLYTSTIVFATQVKVSVVYLLYVKPSLKSQFYVGAGCGSSALFFSKKHFNQAVMCLSPELIFGKEYRNEAGDRRFFQSQISFPTYDFGCLKKPLTKHHMICFPLVVLSYGICF